MKQLKELSLEELKTLYKENEQFSNKVYERAYEGNMYWQSDEYRAIFGDNNRTVSYHDHYSSFYLTIEDHENFANNLEGRDLMTEEAQKLYDKAKELADEWAEMAYDEQDENEELYEKIEETNKQLLEELLDQLHSYEDVSDDQIEDELNSIRDENSYMSEWKTDGKRVYEEITKVYE